MTGTIKHVVRERGFGFVQGDDGKEYFFHRSGVLGSFDELEEGSAVTFEEEPGSPKGPRARHVQVGDSMTSNSAEGAG